MNSSADYNDFSVFLDDELGGDDEFNFIFEDDGGDGVCEFDGLLANSIGSAGIDLKFETIGHYNVVPSQEDEASLPTNSVDCQHSLRSKRERSPSPRPCKQQGFHMNTVNFEPPAKRVSDSDISMSYTRSSSETPSASHQVYEEPTAIHPYTKDQYTKALHNLAESMKRSEMTRRHVMMQHDMLAPEQQRALYLAKERLCRQNQQVQQEQQPSPAVVASFFHASGSFAEKIEESRKKIGMYMSQMNHRTL
eukprot:CAMPEP_0201618764 /NCGR_PEP_ID=MMETSP0492-20130828/39894_1 /ASSEMBLY_ACC=CAM_ASM_000837 /TAXON_ID=420259 /ORGANISM="Thalassiosira gravida, Strain GMp14c1" /LENGTH=249 /DNA_ID=CAMNT_0048087441 /DNA_START=236 /DNA_END=985 /DNA_ORIENTATION=+